MKIVNIKNKPSRIIVTLMGLVLIFLFTAPPVLALVNCCKCTTKDDHKTNICIKTTEPDCSAMPAKSSNPQVKTLDCESLGEADKGQCRAITEGVCSKKPADEPSYSAPSNLSESRADASTGSLTPPKLGIQIPGLQFATELVAQGGYLQIPFIAQYIDAIYTYMIGIAAVAAAIMIVYGGFLYIVGSSGVQVQQGKTVIVDAVIGLLLVLGAYTILETINPAAINLNTLSVKYITPEAESAEVVPTTYLPPTPSVPGQPPPPPTPGEPPAPYTPLAAPPAPTGPFELPPTPGSKGWIQNGNCSFELNQAGVPTVLSTYKCAIEVAAKEEGVHPCYLITVLGKETFLALTNIIGHDENPTSKVSVGGVTDYFPERRKFLNSGKSYRATKNDGGFTFTPLSQNPNLVENRPNDDRVNMSKDDLGLDTRFSHGFGIGLTVVPFGCPINRDKRTWIQPYFSLKGGAQWIKCILDGTLKATDYQTYAGTIYNIFQYWAGCYGPGGVPGKCQLYPKDFNKNLPMGTGSYEKRGGYSQLTIQCLKAKDPWTTVYKGHFTICRGDLPLDPAACEEYVDKYLKNFGVSPKTACHTRCMVLYKQTPVRCVPKTNCAKYELNPAFNK